MKSTLSSTRKLSERFSLCPLHNATFYTKKKFELLETQLLDACRTHVRKNLAINFLIIFPSIYFCEIIFLVLKICINWNIFLFKNKIFKKREKWKKLFWSTWNQLFKNVKKNNNNQRKELEIKAWKWNFLKNRVFIVEGF